MKRFLKALGICVASSAVVFGMASCSNASQSFADKINDKAQDDKKDNEYTYDDVKKKLGKEAIDITIDAPVVGRNGFVVAVKGCKSKADIQKKLDNGDDVKGIVVTIAGGKAVAATFRTITAQDLQSK